MFIARQRAAYQRADYDAVAQKVLEEREYKAAQNQPNLLNTIVRRGFYASVGCLGLAGSVVIFNSGLLPSSSEQQTVAPSLSPSQEAAKLADTIKLALRDPLAMKQLGVCSKFLVEEADIQYYNGEHDSVDQPTRADTLSLANSYRLASKFPEVARLGCTDQVKSTIIDDQSLNSIQLVPDISNLTR